MDSHDTSCEPMDVDISITSSANNSLSGQCLARAVSPLMKSSINVTGLSNNTQRESNDITYTTEECNVKKIHIIRKKRRKIFFRTQETEQGLNTPSKLLLFAICVLPLAVIFYSISNIHCSNNIDLRKLKIKLDNRLYGQEEAMRNFIEALNSDEKSKILFLYGGTGVGKTFTSTLTFEDYWNSSNVYHYTMPSFVTTFSTEVMLGLNFCDTSFVVVDDLKQKDFQVKEHITEIITKSKSLNKRITVLLIFNCDNIGKDFIKNCDNTFYSELSKAFEDVKVYKRFIEFKPLTQEVLRLCIEDELNDKSVSDQQLNSLFHNFNVTTDGCKGVYKKVKFLNLL